MDISNVLRQLRLLKGIKQKELASFLGCSLGTVSNYENGVHEPDLETICRLAEFFDVSTDFLLGHEKSATGFTSLVIHDDYTLNHLLLLLPRLSEQDRSQIVYLLKLLEKTHAPKPSQS